MIISNGLCQGDPLKYKQKYIINKEEPLLLYLIAPFAFLTKEVGCSVVAFDLNSGIDRLVQHKLTT